MPLLSYRELRVWQRGIALAPGVTPSLNSFQIANDMA
jgi:hypothetical protein